MSRFGFPSNLKSTNPKPLSKGIGEHKIDCQEGALSSFQYKLFGKDQLKCNYKCMEPTKCSAKCKKSHQEKDKKRCKLNHTVYKDYGNGKVDYLGRFHPLCKAGEIITSFNYERKNKEGRFAFRCCPAKVNDCKVIPTKPSSYDKFELKDLDKQNVTCPNPSSQAIRGFKLMVNFKTKQIYFNVDCCTIAGR